MQNIHNFNVFHVHFSQVFQRRLKIIFFRFETIIISPFISLVLEPFFCCTQKRSDANSKFFTYEKNFFWIETCWDESKAIELLPEWKKFSATEKMFHKMAKDSGRTIIINIDYMSFIFNRNALMNNFLATISIFKCSLIFLSSQFSRF